MSLKRSKQIPLEPIVREAMVLESSPNRITEFLQTRALKAISRLSYDEWLLPNLESQLLARNDRLIDLGLAAYGYNEEVGRTLFHRSSDDLQMRAAVLGNRVRCGSPGHPCYLFDDDIWKHEPKTGLSLSQFLAAAKESEIEALFSNPNLSVWFLLSLLEGKDEWQALPEDHQRLALRALARGKVIDQAIEEGDKSVVVDTWADARRLLNAAWNLCAQVPVTRPWSYTMAVFMEALPTRWSTIKNFDELLLRWRASEERDIADEIGQNKNGDLSYFQHVRRHFSRAHLWGKAGGGLEHEDIAVRLAAYSMAKMTNEQVRKAIEMDGVLTYYSFLKNKRLWESPEARHLIGELAEKADGDNGLLIESRRYQLRVKKLEVKHPEWFVEATLNDGGEDDAQPPQDDEDSKALALLIASQDAIKKKITILAWVVGILAAITFFRG